MDLTIFISHVSKLKKVPEKGDENHAPINIPANINKLKKVPEKGDENFP